MRQLIAIILVGLVAYSAWANADTERLRVVAANTSIESGIVPELMARFEGRFPQYRVELIATGGLNALELARKGGIDAVITHHPPSEKVFIADGYGVSRTTFMYNDFVLFGPASDPLGLTRERDLITALRLLADEQVDFSVPGHMSGTYQKLAELWAVANVDPQWLGYESTGMSAGATLKSAALFDTYGFADMATYLSVRDELGDGFLPLYRDHQALRNYYSFVVVSTGKVPAAHQEGAELLLEFLTSEETQDAIRRFGVDEYQSQIYTPASHLDTGLRARRAAEEIEQQQQVLMAVSSFAAVLFLVCSAAIGLYMRTRELERQRKINEERFELAVAGTDDGIWDWDISNGRLYLSPRMQTIMGGADEGLASLMALLDGVLHETDHERVLHNLRSYLSDTDDIVFDAEFRIETDADIDTWTRLRGRASRNGDGRPYRMSGSMTDITEFKQQQKAIHHQAFHDALTGLPNRVLLEDRVDQVIALSQRGATNFALLMMDLDRFKEINDTLGHHMGDQVLKEVAHRLKGLLRDSDTVARLGGDEFAILLPRTNATRAGHVAKKIAIALKRPFSVGEQSLVVKGSVGIAMFPSHGNSYKELMQHADVAMYHAKRNNLSSAFYSPAHDPNSVRRLALEKDLRDAIESGALELQYQPQVDLQNKTVVGSEALVRWMHPEKGAISPDEIIPLAEQTGLIGPLTTWAIDTALRQVAVWRKAGVELPVHINLSVWSLQDPDFAYDFRQRMSNSSVPVSLISFEITESAMMADPDQAVDTLNSLSEMGIHLAIDDFGTGFSSLAYLKRLPVHCLKIDGSFVKNMCNDESDMSIVRSTIEMAHNLGLTVVAEGVENADTLNVLAELGCDAAQGYYVARPMSASGMTSWTVDSPWGIKPVSGKPTLVVSGRDVKIH